MKKIERIIEENDLDKVSGGVRFRPSNQYRIPFFCQNCGTPIGEYEDIKDGFVCLNCGFTQKINSCEDGSLRII